MKLSKFVSEPRVNEVKSSVSEKLVKVIIKKGFDGDVLKFVDVNGNLVEGKVGEKVYISYESFEMLKNGGYVEEYINEDIRKFLEFLKKFNKEGKFEVRCLKDGVVRYREYFDKIEDLIGFLEKIEYEYYDIYVSLVLRDNKETRLIFVDIDNFNDFDAINERLWKYGINPILVANSGNGLHMYFLLDRFVSFEEYYELSEILYELLENILNDLKLKVDYQNIDFNRCVRLIGSFNNKKVRKRSYIIALRNEKDENFVIKVDKIKQSDEFLKKENEKVVNRVSLLFDEFLVGEKNKDEVKNELENEIKKLNLKYLDAEKILRIYCIAKFFGVNFEIFDKVREIYEYALAEIRKNYKTGIDKDGIYVEGFIRKVRLKSVDDVLNFYYKEIFGKYLSKKIESLKKEISGEKRKNYQWIEKIFNNEIVLYDARVRFLMFAGYRYLLKIKKMSVEDALKVIEEWLNKTEEERRKRGLEGKKISTIKSWVRSAMKNYVAKGMKYDPISLKAFLNLISDSEIVKELENRIR